MSLFEFCCMKVIVMWLFLFGVDCRLMLLVMVVMSGRLRFGSDVFVLVLML